ncbi:hypothetical protein AARAC_008378 [Aspergillus arachidicola]|uniref:Uncharacterized protein n=1 Tax=Aspergillus arachidicola TaxID=656916 RepID=A0A2G7G2R1_9EURO|nr:hypothetical protein AARAC_008378 [Aspergillus arachidicola]
MAAARLRKAFRYPDNLGDGEHEREELDEEEQDCASLNMIARRSFRKMGLTLYLAGMLASIMLARKVMLSVDIKHLEDLRYEYKGV